MSENRATNRAEKRRNIVKYAAIGVAVFALCNMSASTVGGAIEFSNNQYLTNMLTVWNESFSPTQQLLLKGFMASVLASVIAPSLAFLLSKDAGNKSNKG